MIDTGNLRRDVPQYDVPSLYRQWKPAAQAMGDLGEGSVFRAMSIGTRRILFQAVRAMGARRVLDIGTYNGTSALMFALAVGDTGEVVTVDVLDINADGAFWQQDGRSQRPAELMQKAGVDSRVRFVTRDATEYLRETDERFDLVCIDASKSEQGAYDQIVLACGRLNAGGIIFMDDVFADGVPMPGGYYEPGHWAALTRLQKEGAIRAVPLVRTLEGSRIACAWVVRAC